MKFNWLKAVAMLAVVVGFASCEVEFDPNEQWKPTTIIYGVLDQDEDTTFVRVQKGFLGSGNYLDFAKERDSIYYRQDEIDVFMLAYYPWEKDIIRDTFWFEYTETTHKEEGVFYSENAPLYYYVNNGQFAGDEWSKMEYRLVVRNRQSGETTWASTKLIGDYDITLPGSIMNFATHSGRKIMTCQWYNINSYCLANNIGMAAKLYQPVMRFYYRNAGVETYADIELASRINTRFDESISFKFDMAMDDLLDGMKTKLKDHKGNCSWTNRQNAFELYINSCSLDMYEYYSNSLQSGSSLSDKPIYTNVKNGYGLFAARRKHIKLTFTKDDANLLSGIKDLGYGF